MADGRPATGYVADRLVGVAGWAGGEPGTGAGRAGGALRLPVSEAAGWPAAGRTGACRVNGTSSPAGGLFPGILIEIVNSVIKIVVFYIPMYLPWLTFTRAQYIYIILNCCLLLLEKI
jgi:hypothetical protein